MGWLPLVSSLKLHVSFAKEPFKRDHILQKRPILLRRVITHISSVMVLKEIAENIGKEKKKANHKKALWSYVKGKRKGGKRGGGTERGKKRAKRKRRTIEKRYGHT